MARTTVKTVAPGIRVREDDKRNYKGRPDRYFALRFSVNGKQYEEALGWASEGWNVTKAQVELARLKAARATGDGPATLQQRRTEQQAKIEREQLKPTFEIVRAAYVETLSASMQTVSNSYCRRHLQEILPMKVENIRTAHIDALKKGLSEKGLSPKMVCNILAFVRAVILWGARRGYCEQPLLHNLCFELPHVDNIVTESMDKGELQTFIDGLSKYPNKRLATALLFALYTGMRRRAIFSLRWADIDFVGKTILLRGEHAKNKTTEFVPLSSDVAQLLQGMEQGNQDDLIFGEKDPYSRAVKHLTRYIEEYLPSVPQRSQGIRERKFRPFHGLRHTFASMLAASGVSLYEISKLLTHSPAMSQRYAHIANASLREKANIVGNIVAQAVNADIVSNPNDNAGQGKEAQRAKIQQFK